MLCGFAEIRMEMSLLEREVQLMTLSATSSHTGVLTSLQCQILCPSSVVVSPSPVHLTSASPRMFHRSCFSSLVIPCTFQQACRDQTFCALIVVSSYGSLIVVFAHRQKNKNFVSWFFLSQSTTKDYIRVKDKFQFIS